MIKKCIPSFPSLPQDSSEEYNAKTKTDEMDIAVNVDYDNEKCTEVWKFRVSDENNGDIYYTFVSDPGISTGNRKLILRDSQGKDRILMLYVRGSGIVRLVEPNGELIGECNSVVGFKCLSIKVKYLFNDNSGERIFKIRTEMHPYSNESSFKLNIKNSNNEAIGCIKMGRLKSCCHVTLNQDHFSKDESKWIIALWTTFMDYELLENNTNDDDINPEKIP